MIEKKEKLRSVGKIIVISGRTGSGKDFLVEELANMNLEQFGLSRVVTHATRAPRSGEIDHVHYHFCSQSDLFNMHQNGELVEEPVETGTSYKGTSKAELLQVLEGKNKIWRIDLSLAAKIARGEYYHEQFDSETADILKQSTLVVYIDVDQQTLDARRRSRDGDKYDSSEYLTRDAQEIDIINSAIDHFNTRLPNPDGRIDKTKEELLGLVLKFLENK